MDIFWKVIGGSLIALVLGLVLKKRNPDVSVLLDLLVCGMLLAIAMVFLSPILDYLKQLAQIGGLDSEKLEILMKATALGLLSQIASMLCTDAGNSALGKGIEIAAACAILWISLPLLTALTDLIKDTLGQL
jgi:stage III sporulation protein AD